MAYNGLRLGVVADFGAKKLDVKLNEVILINKKSDKLNQTNTIENQIKSLIKWLENEKDLAVTESEKAKINAIFGVNIDYETQSKLKAIERHIDKYSEPWYDGKPESSLTEQEKIQYILKNKLNWKKLGIKKVYPIYFSSKENGSYRVVFVNQKGPIGGNIETRILELNLTEWEPCEDPKKPFDRERFERILCAVVASKRYDNFIEHRIATEFIIKRLDAYYEKQGGANE